MKNSLIKKLSIISTLLLMPNLSFALGTATTTFDVTANVVEVCTVAVQTLPFGSYDGLTNSDAQTTMSVTCDADSTPTFKLDGGLNSFNSFRRLSDAGKTNHLEYSLYSDASRTIAIPIDTVDSNITIIPDGASHDYTLYGRIASGQAVATGNYSDTLTVTIGF